MRVSEPFSRSASTALAGIRHESDPARKAAVASDALDQVSHDVVADTAGACTVEMVRAAAGATGDRDARLSVYTLGLESLAEGGAASTGALCQLAMRLMHAASKKNPKEQVAIFGATMQALAQRAPDAAVREKADLMRAVAMAAPGTDSAAAAAEAALGSVGFGDSLIGRLGARLVPQAFGLRALAGKMARKGVHDGSRDDRRPMARAAVAFLAAPEHGGDRISQMAARAISDMRFSDTSGDVALASLKVPLRSAREASPGSVTMAKAGAGFVRTAYAGDHKGQWVDEKSAVAKDVLAALEESAPSESVRSFAHATRGIVGAVNFTRSAEAIAAVALDALSASAPSDRALARTFIRMMDKALASDTVAGNYRDDKSVVASHAAEMFATHGETPDARKWGSLLQATLAPRKFTESNVALARHALAAIASGRPADDRNMAQVLGRMMRGALNTNAVGGKFQADKSTVMNAAIPWLEANVTDAASTRIVAMWKTAVADSTFALSADRVSAEATKAIAKGQGDDRAMGRLALSLTEAAHAGETAGWTYKDDKTGVALRTAAMLATSGTEASTREWATFLQKSLDGIAFTKTAANLAPLIFSAIADGVATDGPKMAAMADRLVQKAIASETSQGTWRDDRQKVGLNATTALAATGKLAGGAELANHLVHDALASCTLSDSIPGVASAGFSALARGGLDDRAALAHLGMALVRAGKVGDRRQDQGPVASGVAGAFATGETRFASTQEAFRALEAMMDTGADHRERVRVLEKGLALWASQDPSVATDPMPFVLQAAHESTQVEAERDMLAAAIPILARSKGPAVEKEAAAAVAQCRGKAPGSALESLRAFVQVLATRPAETEKVERMADALNGKPPKEAGTVEVEEEFVVIGGVRIRKQTPGE